MIFMDLARRRGSGSGSRVFTALGVVHDWFLLMPARCCGGSDDGLGVWVQAVGEGGVAAAGALGADGGGQGAAGSG